MRYKGLNLNLLHALDVLMETRNVSRAAERLGLTQSALSAALAQLRQYFGDQLLVSDGRRMCPTVFAEQLQNELGRFLDATDAVLLTSRVFDPASTRRVFRVIASDYIVAAILAPLTEALSVFAPNIRLEFISPDEAASESLRIGELDLLISPREFMLPDSPTEDLFEEEIVVAGWSGNPAFAEGIDFDAFLSSGHVAVAIGRHRQVTFADKHLLALGHVRKIECVASSFTTVPWLLRGTQRLAMMHRRLAQVMAGYLPLAYSPLPFAFPAMRETAQYHRTRTSDQGLHWLIGAIRIVAEEPEADVAAIIERLRNHHGGSGPTAS
ncbi:LysR family transcriptional regulator [Croceibacterium mercuriale]|uniref:LysR family transcriptional regulator n=1 Tax=Croceibacterium mercuriale TaxID=1572751 RepID=UPI0009DFD566|nr:LysR family transcriptional regulator [Croceibacterium mercuriale]